MGNEIKKESSILDLYDESKEYTVDELTEIVKTFKDVIQSSKDAMEERNKLETTLTNGCSVVALMSDEKTVVTGKYNAKFNIIIDMDGNTYPASDIITFNTLLTSSGIQDALFTMAVSDKIDELNKNENPSEEDIEAVIVSFVSSNPTYMQLSDDRKKLVTAFMRNLRNGNVDIITFKFVISNILYNEDEPNYFDNEVVDLQEVNNICVSYYKFAGVISKETYDEIFERLSMYATETGESSKNKSPMDLASRFGIDLRK
jgi:hypothetical protein